MKTQKYFKYVSELGNGNIDDARKKSAHLILSIDEQLLYNFFIEDGVYTVRDNQGTHLVAVVNQRDYDTSRVFLFSNKKILNKIYDHIQANPKIGLYRKEQGLLGQIRKMGYEPYEPDEETLMRYVYFNFNSKIYLLKWRLNNDKKLTEKQRVLGEKNFKRLLDKAKDELNEMWQEERNVEALEDNSTLEDYDTYNYTSDEIVIDFQEEFDNYYYDWE